MTGEIRIVHNEDARRYELSLDGTVVSVAEYQPAGDVVIFDHTQTTPAFRGRGFAERLVAFALDDVRKRGRKIVPECWFVADFVAANPAYRDLVAA